MITFRSFIQRKSRPVVAALGSMLTFRNVVLPLLFGAIMVCTHIPQVQAGPKDGNVVAGDANIVQLNPKLLEIIQASDKVIIDWRSFSIDWDELVRFLQPDSDSIALNRVNGDTPSYILGQLTADGRVMLINPNGVLFGDSAVVDIGSLVATTIDIRNEDFMAGDYNFDVDRASGGTVVNRGRITAAEGGIVALVAPGVENSGVIVARLGRVALASGNSFALDFYGDRLIQIGVDDSVAERLLAPDGTELKALVDNSGEIYADGGTVMLMAASVAKDVVDYAINMEGIIEARTATERNGQIVLEGAGEGIVRVTGTLDASGRESGDTGGEVKILGSKVGLVGQAEVDVSGDAGGGEVLIGGNFQGRGPERNADFTTIGREVAIQADALTTGDGGRVIVWSDRVTRFYGNISARGGRDSGAGGFAEISGKQHLQFAPNSIDLSAPKGLIGELLLDPLDIVISDADGSDDSAVSGDNVIYFNDDSTATYNITPAAFEAIDADITLQALQDITVSSPIDRTGSGDSTLTLQAGRNLTIDANITGSNGAHSFIFEADSPRSSNNDGVGTLTIASGVTITSSNRTSNTGDITFGHITLIGAEFDINATSSINAGGDIYVAPSRAVAMMISTAASDLSNTNLSNAEIGRFITSGTIYIGTATTGPDGSGGAGSSISASGITVSEDLTISGSADSTLALQAGGALTINADITGSMGAHSFIFEADSPGSSNNDGTGTLKIASGVIITSNNGDITLIGAGFEIDTTSSINAGTGDIHVAPSRSVPMTISTTADLSLAEIGRFTTSGTIHIGTATSGSGGAGSTISASSITVGEALTISGSASLVLDSGGMTTLSADVSTYDGDITFEDAVTLGANVTVKSDADGDATDGNITFASTVEGGQMLTLDADSGAVEFRGAVGGTSATSKLVSLTVDGYLIRLKSVRTTGEIKVTMPSIGFGIYLNGDYLSDDGDITFVGDLRLDGAVRVDSDANDDATDGNISLTFQVIGNGHALTVDAGSGEVTLRTTVGTTTKLGSLTVTGGQIHIGSVRTINNIDITGTNIDLDLLAEFKSEDGNITFTGPVDLLADVTVDSDADDDGTAGDIKFTSTVDSASGGNRKLTVNAGSGEVAFEGAVGTTKLSELAVTGAKIKLSANVSTDNGAITFTGAVELLGDVTVDSDSAGGDIKFTSTVDSASGGNRKLTVNAGSGEVAFEGAVGTTKLSELAVTGAKIKLSANVSTDNGAITFTGAVELLGDVTVDSAAAGGDIKFTSTVDSASGGNRTLTVNAGSGEVAFEGAVGATTKLSELAVTGAKIKLSANVSTDNGAITFTGAVELLGDVTVDSAAAGGDIKFTSTVDSASGGNRTLTVNAGSGEVAFEGAVGATTKLSELAVTGAKIKLSANVSTDNGAITFTGAVELLGDVTVDSAAAGGDIKFTSTVDSASGGNRKLTVNAGSGEVAFEGAVGTTKLSELAVTGAKIKLSANVSTDNGAITFTGAVELLGDVTVDSAAAGGDIKFTSTVDSASGGNRKLTVNAGSGEVAFEGAVGATTKLSELAVTGAKIKLSANVSTDNGAITFTGAVELLGDVTVDSAAAGGDIKFTSTVDSASGGNRKLTVNAGSGEVAFEGAVGTTKLSELAVTGAKIKLSANVSTDNGAITFTGAVELLGDVTVDSAAAGGDIKFTSTVDSASGGNRTLTVNAGSGEVAFEGAVGTTKLSELAVTGAKIKLSANVSTDNGAITFTGAVELLGDVTVDSDSAGGDIKFTSTVDSASGGNRTLTVNAGSGEVAFEGAVGTTKLSELAVTGAKIKLSANVSTDNGAITFTGAVELLGDVTVDSDSAGGDIKFTSTVDSASGGNRTLTVNAGSGEVAFEGAVGTTKLSELAVTGAKIKLSANVSTDNGAITFTGAVELLGDVTVDSDSAGGDIKFTSTVDSASGGNRTLTVNAGSGEVAFEGAVGTTKLSELAVTGAKIKLSANVSTDNGAITFTGAVELLGDVTVDSAAAGGDIKFTSTVDSASGGNRKLTVNAGSGEVAFEGAVGATTKLSELAVTGAKIKLSANVSTDNGAITFTGAVELLGDVTVDSAAAGGDIKFTSTVDSASGGNRKLTVNAGSGEVAFEGAVGATTKLSELAVTGAKIKLSANVSTDNGAITFTGAVELLGDVTVDSAAAGGDIKFTSTVDSASGGNRTLTVNAGSGEVAFEGAVGGTSATTKLSELAVTGAKIKLSANVSTDNGAITFTGAVELLGDVTVDSDSAGGDITFTSTVDSASGGNRKLTVNAGSGEVAFEGAVGATTKLSELAVTGAKIKLSANVSTDNGAITFTGAVELLGDVTVDSAAAGGAITFTSTVDSASGGNRKLTVNAGSGEVAFEGAVGGTSATTKLSELAVTGAKIKLSANVSTDNGAITFTGAVELLGDVTVDSDSAGGAITFTSTVDSASGGNRKLTVNAGSGEVAFEGAVGATTKLSELAVTGAKIKLSANVSTDNGAITFTGAVELLGDVTVDSAAAGGDIKFTSTVDSASGGNRKLTVNAGSGEVAFEGAVGATTKLSELAVTGAKIKLSANVSTDNGAITFTGAVELLGDVTVDSAAAGGAIKFTSTVDSASGGNRTLTVNAGSGEVAFEGAVGGTSATTKLSELAVTGAKIKLSANVSTDNGAITFTGAVELLGDVTVDSDSAGGDIKFTSTVDSASGGNRTLTVNAGSGEVAFEGAVGGTSATTKLSELAVTGAKIKLSANVSTDNGAITFTGAVDLLGDVTVDSDSAGGAITFTSTVDGAHELTVNAGSGTVAFEGAVGGTTKLASLTVTGGQIDLYTVATTGDIDIEGSTGIALNGATYASDDGDITFGGAGGVTISGSSDSTVSLQAGGDLTINTNITGRNGAHSLIFEADSPGLSSNDGNGTLKIESGVIITSNNGDITLIGAGFDIDTSSSIDAGTGDIHVAPSRAVAMTISTTANLSLAEIGRFTTSGTIYIGTATTGPTGTGGAGSSISAISITVSEDLTISGSASLVLDSSGATTLSADVSTHDGDITFKDAVTLAGNVTVKSNVAIGATGGDITFISMLDGAYNLMLNSGTGNIYFGGDVGSADKLSAITVNNAHDVTVAVSTTMWVGSFTQTAGTGTTDFGLNTVNADTSVNVTTVNIRGKIVTQEARLTAQEDIISTVEVDSLTIEASNAYLFGTIDGVGGRAASDLIEINNRGSGTYTINGYIVLGTGLGTRTYVELSSLPLATITPAAGVFAWLTPMLRASVNDSISGPYIVTDSEASSPLLTPEHGAEDYYEDIPLLLKTHDDEMVEME